MDSADAYEFHARQFLRVRDKSFIGSRVVNRWARNLESGATVIEFGCGGGYPITQALCAAGLELWAVDSSETLIAEFQRRFPDIPVQRARIQESSFFDRSYHGAIAIGLIFLLSESEQVETISNVARILIPGGRFLFTAPIETGSWVDTNTGLPCRSLGQAAYEECLESAGLRTVATYVDAGRNNYYDVKRLK